MRKFLSFTMLAFAAAAVRAQEDEDPGQGAEDNCRLTTPDVEGPFFERGAPEAVVIAPEEEMTDLGGAVFSGRVVDRRCRPVAGATVDVWYAGGERPHYTFPRSDEYLWYRGKQQTDQVKNNVQESEFFIKKIDFQDGTYEFRGTFPGSYRGRPIPHVHYKVTHFYFQDVLFFLLLLEIV